MAHAKLPPSSAARWLDCPASAGQSSPETAYSRLGTEAHERAAALLAPIAAALDAREPLPVVRDAGDLQPYIDAIYRVLAECDRPRLLVEQRVVVVEGECWGTADAVIHDESEDGPTLHIVDLKTGAGVFVAAEQNVQLGVYALGAQLRLPTRPRSSGHRMHLHIVQPRCPDSEGKVHRRWEAPGEWLDELFHRVVEVAAMPEAVRATKFGPGEACAKFCPRSGNCEAQRTAAFRLAQDAFGEASLSPVTKAPAPSFPTLTEEALAQVLAIAPRLREFLAAAEKEVEARLRAGTAVEGWKLVEAKGHRRWKDEVRVAQLLRANGIDPMGEPKLVSPAEAERRGGKFAKLLIENETTTPSSLKLAPSSDRRPAVNPMEFLQAAADEFEALP